MLALLNDLVSTNGYWIVAATVGLESMGLPLPGEAMLIAAALYAGATHRLEIAVVVLVAMAGAVLGTCAGFAIGRRFRGPLLRYGRLVGVKSPRLRLGQSLLERHGGKVVFFGRFVVVLRTLAGIVAGLSSMGWRRFMVFNTISAAVWAVGYGTTAYLFGARGQGLAAPAAIGLSLVSAVLAAIMIVVARRERAALEHQPR